MLHLFLLEGKAYKYVLKESGQDIKDFINLSKLKSGRYYVFAEIDGEKYNIGNYIDIQ